MKQLDRASAALGGMRKDAMARLEAIQARIDAIEAAQSHVHKDKRQA